MARQQQQQQVVLDLDQRWSGVDEREHPSVVPGSSEVQNGATVRAAVNARFTGQYIETRPGYRRDIHYTIPEGTLDMDASDAKLVGAGQYVDPVTHQPYVLLALRRWVGLGGGGVQPPVAMHVYRCGAFTGPLPMQFSLEPYDAANVFTASMKEADLVRFTQLGRDVVMWRRGGEQPWLWNGDTAEFDTWLTITEVEPNGDTPTTYVPLPAADFGVVAAERLVFPYESGIGWTDIGEARRWGKNGDASGQLPRMDIGDDGGRVTGLLWWRGSVLLVFKERSVWAVEGWTGGLESLVVKPITRAAGCISPDTVAEVGGDVFWLGRGGVYSIGRALDTDTRIKEVPVSAPIPKTMARINWTRAHLSSAVHVRGHYTLAVPLDGAQFPDTLLHFCTERPGWQGSDTIGGGLGTDSIVTLVPCLLGGSQTWSAVRRQDVITQGWSPADKTYNDGPGAGSIPFSVTFREFHAQDHSLTRWLRMEARTEESGTTGVTFSAQLPGRMGTLPLQDSTTRDRTKWMSAMRVARDMTNHDDDFLSAGREDYAFVLESTGIELQSGISTVAVQEHTLAGNVVGTARGLAPKITTTGGLIKISVIRGAGV